MAEAPGIVAASMLLDFVGEYQAALYSRIDRL
jgi:hypothetical protein